MPSVWKGAWCAANEGNKHPSPWGRPAAVGTAPRRSQDPLDMLLVCTPLLVSPLMEWSTASTSFSVKGVGEVREFWHTWTLSSLYPHMDRAVWLVTQFCVARNLVRTLPACHQCLLRHQSVLLPALSYVLVFSSWKLAASPFRPQCSQVSRP